LHRPGSRSLFQDEELTPVKGQLSFLPPQPEVDYIVMTGDFLYMYPRQDGILVAFNTS
jgi:D-amino-acid oxidase